ncbi:hypothetical protein [Vibrio mediterranei]|uniref:hypothetical protein n=1 Tax=Vibrio mediterranei TaxID=689 RepID=UPI0022834698|nr:hypothetical protein [Vibrio mediterranei]MCY9852191.1 hypothetical protein [Vibrio mediterranei]
MKQVILTSVFMVATSFGTSATELTKEKGTELCPVATYASGGICLMEEGGSTYVYTKDIEPIIVPEPVVPPREPKLTDEQKFKVLAAAYITSNNGDIGVEPIEPTPVEDFPTIPVSREELAQWIIDYIEGLPSLDPRKVRFDQLKAEGRFEEMKDAAKTIKRKLILDPIIVQSMKKLAEQAKDAETVKAIIKYFAIVEMSPKDLENIAVALDLIPEGISPEEVDWKDIRSGLYKKHVDSFYKAIESAMLDPSVNIKTKLAVIQALSNTKSQWNSDKQGYNSLLETMQNNGYLTGDKFEKGLKDTAKEFADSKGWDGHRMDKERVEARRDARLTRREERREERQ